MTITPDSGASPSSRRRRGRARRALSVALAVSLACVQALVPAAHAQDTTPPSIDHDPVREIAAGGRERIEATVVDDESGVTDVTLNLGLGDGGFEALRMESEDGERYLGTLSAEDLIEGDSLSYYLTAIDAAGNEQSRGFAFDPLVVRVGPPGADAPVVADSGRSTTWYIVGGAVALGLLAALAGGGSGGGGTEAPAGQGSGPRLGQEILVR